MGNSVGLGCHGADQWDTVRMKSHISPFMKFRLRSIARKLGIVARLGDSVRRDIGSFCLQLSHLGFRPKTIIDVGVADGTLELYAPFPQARLFLVEPIKEFQGAIEQILSRLDGECHYVAAGAHNGTANFAVWDRAADLHGAKFAPGDEGRSVPVRRLDDIARHCEGPILLKIDVEGSAWDVMKGATGLLPKIEVAILETRLFDVLGGQAILHEVVGTMWQYGFVVYDILSTIARPLDGALILCDLAFVRADSILRQDNRFATDEQSRAHERKLLTRARHLLGV